MKCRLFFTFICVSIFFAFGIEIGKSNELLEKGILLTYKNVMGVEVHADGPLLYEHQQYNYTTVSKNEIAYILNYFNNFHLKDDGKYIVVNDGSYYSVKFYMHDGSVKEYGFGSGDRFYDTADKQYAIDRNEYHDFLNFINALKTKKVDIKGEVSFEPSEWARADVEKAINQGLVPELFQINYNGKINRLEVCRLLDNLLQKQNIATLESNENPFVDTADKGVINLYWHGIIVGKTEDEFYPYDYMTREELAKVLSKIYRLIQTEVQFDADGCVYVDQDEIADWAKDSVAFVSNYGIMVGDAQNQFRPKDGLTKQEMIVTLLRLRSHLGTKTGGRFETTEKVEQRR